MSEDIRFFFNYNIFLPAAKPDMDVNNVLNGQSPVESTCVHGGTIVVGTRRGEHESLMDRSALDRWMCML